MGKVFFSDPVDHISGKLSRKYRTIYNHRRANKLNFTSVREDRTTPYTEDELRRQQHFADVAKRTRQRMQDPAQMTQDAAAFSKQSKYRTLYQYIFHLEWNAEA